MQFQIEKFPSPPIAIASGSDKYLLFYHHLTNMFHLQMTNTLTCGALLATGDLIQQKIEKVKGQNQGLDSARLGKATDIHSPYTDSQTKCFG
jgi:hypothetical protein